MDYDQAKTLTVNERVTYDNTGRRDGPHHGTVTAVYRNSFAVQWDDGLKQEYRFNRANWIERKDKKP